MGDNATGILWLHEVRYSKDDKIANIMLMRRSLLFTGAPRFTFAQRTEIMNGKALTG